MPQARAWCEDRGLFLQSGTAWGVVDRDYLRQLADAFTKVEELLVS